MIYHKAVERDKRSQGSREREREMRDHNTVEICDRSQSSRERERER